jgi:nucleoside-diphosphate-sugar epimerase
MKILVTGNMGYIGPCVVRHMRTFYPEASLIGLDTGFFANCLTNSNVFPECMVSQQIFADVRNLPEDALKGIDAIVHLAAISNDPMGNTFEEVTFDINYKATVKLARKAKKAGVKSFVFASSCSIYGSADDRPRTEKSELGPLTAYAKSKVLSESELAGLADKTFKVTSLRYATACGMSDRLRLDLVLNDFVAGAITSGKITILSDGTPWRPLINVKDMARAIDWALMRPVDCGGVFLAINVGSNDWNYQVRDLAHAVAQVMPGVEVEISEKAQPDKRSYRVSFDLFEKLAPEHQPKMDLLASIRDLEEGLEAINFKDPNYRNSKLIRLNVLNALMSKGIFNERLEWLIGDLV